MLFRTHDPCANMHKPVEQIFEILSLKFLAIFLNFTSAAELSRPTSLLVVYFLLVM